MIERVSPLSVYDLIPDSGTGRLHRFHNSARPVDGHGIEPALLVEAVIQDLTDSVQSGVPSSAVATDIDEAPSEFCLANRTLYSLDRVVLQCSVLSVFEPAVLDHQCGCPSLGPSTKCACPAPTYIRRPVIIQAVRSLVRRSVDEKGEPRAIRVDKADVGVNPQVGAA